MLDNLPLIIAVILGITLVILYYIQKRIIEKNKDRIRIYERGRRRDFTNFLFRFYSTIPIINIVFIRVISKISTLYPADNRTITRRAVRAINTSIIKLLLVIAYTVIVFNGNYIYLILGIFMGFVIFRASIEVKMYSMETALLNQFREFISMFHATYRERHGIIEDALLDSIDSLKYEIGLHVSKIYDVIAAPDVSEKLNEYIAMSPNKYIMMFVSLCATTKETGDQEIEGGGSAFVKGVINLESKLNEELSRRTRTKDSLAMSSVWALFGFFAAPLLSMWAQNIAPEIASFYTSASGTIMLLVITIAVYIAYSLNISYRINRDENVKLTSIWMRLSETGRISELLNSQIKRKYNMMRKINDRMRLTGDHTGPKAFLLQSVVFAIVAFIFMNIVFIASNIQLYMSETTNIRADFNTVMAPNEVYLDQMEEITRDLILKYRDEPGIPSQTTIMSEIASTNPTLYYGLYSDSIIESVQNRILMHHQIGYKWWYMFAAVVASVFCFFLPYLLLRIRARMINIEKQDEINSFNALMMIFMHMDNVTLENILSWDEMFSFFYKDDISECIINIPRDQEAAIEKLRNADTLSIDYQQYVKCLSKIDELGARDAFIDLENNQEFYNATRRNYDEKMIKNRTSFGWLAAMVPVIIEIVGYVVYPLLSYGLSNLTRLTNIV